MEASSHQMDLSENNEVLSSIQIHLVVDDVKEDVNPFVDVVDRSHFKCNTELSNLIFPRDHTGSQQPHSGFCDRCFRITIAFISYFLRD